VAEDNTMTIIKFAAIGVGAYLLYEWLQSSGLWAQWFGGGNSFSTPATLLTYCQANPTGSATYTGSGTPTTATCAAWMAANGSSSTTSTTSSAPPATSTPAPEATIAPAAGSTLVPRLQAAAFASSALGADSATVSQWNYLLQQIWPSAPIIQNSTPAGTGSIPAATYVGYYLAQGFADPSLAGAGVSGFNYYDEEPYKWAN
jgi:hypothetical protein